MNERIKADVIGSMLRPQYLLDGRKLFREGKLSYPELKALEDRAVKEAVAIQERAGVDVVTDGEMRRAVFCHNFVDAVDGYQWNIPSNTVIWFDMQGKMIVDPVTVGVVDRIRKKRDISVEEFAFLRGVTDKPLKITIPSPTMLSYYFVLGISNRVYLDTNEYLADVASILKDGVAELARIGATYIQVDAPEFGMLLDPVQQEWFAKKGLNPDTLVKKGVELINSVLEGFPGTTGLHICRGNDKSRFMASGGYDKIAEIVFRKANVNRLLLEYDTDRAGDFSPLNHIPEDKVVVLGLVTTKTSRIETPEELRTRIREASRYIPLERLALSTQCGFASVAEGNAIDFETQFKKLKLVADVAKEVWGDFKRNDDK